MPLLKSDQRYTDLARDTLSLCLILLGNDLEGKPCRFERRLQKLLRIDRGRTLVADCNMVQNVADSFERCPLRTPNTVGPSLLIPSATMRFLLFVLHCSPDAPRTLG